jgi:AefR-like transcriptional repressor, C-terminal domain
VNRLLLGESRRFPELVATFYEVAVQGTGGVIGGWLRRQCERGLIALDNIDDAAGILRGMMIVEPQRAIIMEQQAFPDAPEIAARARTCVKLFLDGCRRDPR